MPSSACIKPDDDAASSVAADTRMMQQAQPKSAATRADATTVRSPSWPTQHGWNIALYQFQPRRPPARGPESPRPRLTADDRALRQLSGIASAGRETAGREVSAVRDRGIGPCSRGLVTRDYARSIPSDARNNHQEGKINDGSVCR